MSTTFTKDRQKVVRANCQDCGWHHRKAGAHTAGETHALHTRHRVEVTAITTITYHYVAVEGTS